jgi:uncharacterized protein (DUF58 family)
LTREGWYYLAVLVFIIGGSVLRSVNLLVVLAGTMIAPLLFNWRLVMASLMGLGVQRRLPTQILAGEPLTVEVAVENGRWWMSSWLLTVEDWVERQEVRGQNRRVPQRSEMHQETSAHRWHRLIAWLSPRRFLHLDAVHSEASIPQVPARGTALGAYRVTLHRRGHYRFGPLRVSTRFPLGLVRGQITLPLYDDLIVSPRLGRLLPEWLNLLEAEMVGDQRRSPQRGMADGDYYGLRPWQSGDSLRWIHWRTTARLARPIVRQYERRKSREVAIVVDPWLAQAHEQQEMIAVELAISFAATAVTDVTSRGHSRLTVAIAGRAVECFSGTASAILCQDVLAKLADTEESEDYDLADAIREAVLQAPQGARVIVVSSRPANSPSLEIASAELLVDPADFVWIDASAEELDRLFTLEVE